VGRAASMGECLAKRKGICETTFQLKGKEGRERMSEQGNLGGGGKKEQRRAHYINENGTTEKGINVFEKKKKEGPHGHAAGGCVRVFKRRRW